MFDVKKAKCHQWNPDQKFRQVAQDANYFDQDHRYTKRSSSMLWDQARHRILTTNEDCTTSPFSSTTNPWEPMSFNHEDERYPGVCVSLLIHGGGETCIGVPGPPKWMSLLPDSNHRSYAGRIEGECELAGDITLILGLIAFSARPRETFDALKATFCPGERWDGHKYGPQDHERQQRGLRHSVSLLDRQH